jgi:2-polyprenyl-3-methyl-5-hydroxy-6-metoxy-1,4-benzoquinol methylase
MPERTDRGPSLAVAANEGSVPTLEEQLHYWKYWQRSRSESQWAQERANAVLELMRGLPVDQPRILDLGCGTGWFSEKLSHLGQVTALDLNEEAMKQARQRWPQIDFVGGNLFEYPFEPYSFDVVVSMQVIAHVGDQPGFVNRAAGLLRAGGHFVLSTNNKFVMRRLGKMDWGSHRAVGHIEKWLSVKDVKRLLSPHFRLVNTMTLIPLGNGGMLRTINSYKLNAALTRLFPPNYVRRAKEALGLGYYILVVAQKPPDVHT